MSNDSAYHRANFSRHPNEVINEIRDAGELANTVADYPVLGRTIPQNPLTGANAIFEGIARRQGFDGLPLLASESEVESLVAARLTRSGLSGAPETAAEFMEQGIAGVFALYRYLYEPDGIAPSPELENARRYAEQFRSGPFFAGRANRYGAGIYFVPYQGVLSGPAVILKAALRDEAKIIGFPALAEQMSADGLNPQIPTGYDPGYYAACRGYDAFFVADDYAGNFYTVVLNRTALVVVETDIVENGNS